MASPVESTPSLTATATGGSSISNSSGSARQAVPSELEDSYFPSASDSDSDGTRSPLTADADNVPVAASTKQGRDRPRNDLLTRDFRKPEAPLDVAAQLAKRPLPRSLHSSLEAAARRSHAAAALDGPEARAHGLAEAKKQWAEWRGF